MALFVFDDSLRLGVTEIDDQHARFVDYINEIDASLERGESTENFLRILQQLLDYAVEHFSSEEALMRKHDYPGYKGHKEIHSATVDELWDFDIRMMADHEEETRAFLDFVVNWLKNHIQGTDTELAAFLKKKGVS